MILMWYIKKIKKNLMHFKTIVILKNTLHYNLKQPRKLRDWILQM